MRPRTKLRAFVLGVGTCLVTGGLLVAIIDVVRRGSWGDSALLAVIFGLLVLLTPVLLHSWRRALGQVDVPQATRDDVVAVEHALKQLSDRNLKKASEYEWRLSQSVSTVERQVGLLTAQLKALQNLNTSKPSGHGTPRILFMTSNGAGLGHVTRMLAIADQLPEFHRTFFTFSSGVTLVRARGYQASYFPSFEAAGVGRSVWKQRMASALSEELDELKPDIVVFDGTYVYEAVTHSCNARGIPLVWSQRGCWKPEVDQQSKQRHAAANVSDAVLIPGDYGCPEVVNVGEGVPRFEVDPISLVLRSEVYSREDSCARLGLDPTLKYVLVQLGSGAIGDIHNSRQLAFEQIRALGPEWRAITARSPISVDKLEPNDALIAIEDYPVSQHFNLFEFCVIAGGYNAVQEAVGLGLPSIVIPNPATVTDDQIRRAQFLQEHGLARVAMQDAELSTAIVELSQEKALTKQRDRLDELRPPEGSKQGANTIRKVIELSRVVGRAVQ